MADLAQLGLVIDSSQVKTGVGELDKLTAAGGKAEAAVNKLGNEAQQAGGQIKTASAQAADYAANAQRMANNSTLTGSSMIKLGAATGVAQANMRRLGSEVGALTSQMATGSIGAQGLASSVGRIGIAALIAVPALGALAAAGALAVLALAGIKNSAASDAQMRKFASTLGLTAKEMKKLEDVTVTFGDVAKATFQVLAEKAGTSADEITGWFSYAFQKIGEFGKFSIAIIYGAFVAGAKGIINTWNAVPAIIGEAAVTAANFALQALEGMVNLSVQKINSLIASVNMLPFVDLPAIAAASFGQIENKWAGTTRKLGETLDADFHAAFDSAMGTMDQISARATSIAQKRVSGQADEIIDDRSAAKAKKAREEKKKGLSDEEKAYLAAMKAAKAYLDALSEETDKIGLSAIEIKRLDVAMAAAAARQAAVVAPTKAGTAALLEQADAIMKAGAAWEMVYKNDQAQQFIKDTVKPLELQVSLLGQSAEAQARATLEAEREQIVLEKGVEAWNRYHVARTAEIDYDAMLVGEQRMLDMLDAIAEQASVTGQIMADAFGGVGDVIGGLVASLADYRAEKAALAQEVKAGSKTQEEADKRLGTLQTKNTMAAITGIKSLFKEHSTAYKVMGAVEKAYAVFKMATSIASIIQGKVETVNEVANAATKTTANTAAGASKIFSQLGVWAFPVVGAMVAVLAALGARGGGGGASGPSIPTAEDVQAGQGAGTVLGDARAKSNSIANSLEIVAANSNKDLEYSNDMLRSLRSIDFGISKMAGTIARQISVSGSVFDTSKLGIGTSSKSGFLGIFGGSTTTKNLWDMGLDINSGSVADILAGGVSGSTYQTIQKIKTKKGFLGFGGGTKTSYSTSTGALDPEISNAIVDVIASLRGGILSAADVVGLQGAEAILDSFNISLGKISLMGMTGEQIEEQLNAIFSNVGDQMAGAVFPALAELQLVGEGLFETFMRVAREYQVVEIALKSIGMEFGSVGVASIAARDHLVQLFESLDEFVEATAFFGENFLSEAERITPIAASVTAEMARLGLAGITTRDQFKAAVLGLDLTTTAGAEMYAALLKVAPAFDKVLDYFEKANKALADTLKSTADQFNGFATSLRKYRDTLFATEASQGNAYATLRAKFASTAALAATGDAGALGGLESAGKDFLTVARNNASSMQQYLRDVALVARGVDGGIFAAESVADYAELQLAALNNSVSILGTIAANTAATATALGVTPGTSAVASPVVIAGAQSFPSGESKQAVTAEITALRDDLKAALEAIASHTAGTERVLKRWDDGDALAITTRDGDTVDVNLESWG